MHELDVAAGETTAIIGQSGCGKTTLLRLVCGILAPNQGTVEVLDRPVQGMGELARRRFRVANLGLVFQDFELLDYLTAEENVLLPYRVSGGLPLTDDAVARVTELTERTGIGHLRHAYPDAMSQGERQRVAICRALVTRPRLILADEPTGSLDPENQRRIVELLRASAAEAGASLVMVTHDHDLLADFDRVIDLPKLRAAAGVGDGGNAG